MEGQVATQAVIPVAVVTHLEAAASPVEAEALAAEAHPEAGNGTDQRPCLKDKARLGPWTEVSFTNTQLIE